MSLRLTAHAGPHAATAPAEMNEPYRRISKTFSPPRAGTYEEKTDPARVARLAEIPTEASDSHLMGPTLKDAADMSMEVMSAGDSRDAHSDKRPQPRPLQQPAEPPSAPADNAPAPALRPDWGTSFPVTWIRVRPLSFTRTRHLRNPWNADREVKVSRDGTELEPNVGRQLLAQWDELPITPPPVQRKKGGNSRGRRG
jgi:hypothetical protein